MFRRLRLPPEFINEVEIRFVGIRRSGNHAVINWLATQFDHPVHFINNAPARISPFAWARGYGDEKTADISNTVQRFPDDRPPRFEPKQVLLYSHEDCFLDDLAVASPTARRDRYVGTSRRRFDVLLLRDPYNLFASRFAFTLGDMTPDADPLIVDKIRVMWKQHAREFLGETAYLGPETIRIDFSRWRADATFRKEVAGRLGRPLNDDELERVPDVARGSSFDALARDGEADLMDLDQRWRHYLGDPRFRRVTRDRELVELAERIFGPAPFPVDG